MGKGQKINDRLRELILVELATNENCSEISRIFGVAESTVRKIRDESQDRYAGLRDQKKRELIDEATQWKREFLKRAEESINKAIDLSQQKIALALVSHEKFDERIDSIIDLLRDKEADYRTVVDTVKALSSVMAIPLKDLSIYIGTVYDKRALAQGEATSNIGATVTNTHKLDLKSLSEEELAILERIITK